jgi:uncharacterized membrane protein (DUF4010 family)
MSGIEWTFELRFLIALGLGFLVGLERETTKAEHKWLVIGGVRTFPIIAMIGFGTAWLFKQGVTFVLPAGLLAVAALTVVAYLAKVKAERYGATSELSVLLTFVVGALAAVAEVWIPMALGIVNAFLLSEKPRLESAVERLDKNEFLAVLKFLLITLIVLPVLPDQEYTRFGLNPYSIWIIVILVSSIGFAGYYLSKRLGHRAGLWLSGVLGGVVSSTALTVAMGRIAQRQPDRSRLALQSAVIGSAMMYVRILVLVAVIGPAYLESLWWKLLVLFAVGVVLSLSSGLSDRKVDGEVASALPNPFELKPALLFAVAFVGLLVVTRLAQDWLGAEGLLALSAVVGVIDIDPFILSLLGMANGSAGLATSAIIIAMMSNTVAKGIYFSVLATAARRDTLIRYGIWATLHLPLIFS